MSVGGRGAAGAASLFAVVAAVSFGALGAALVSQHVFAMQPCPWCVLQRLVFVAIGVIAVAGLLWRSRSGRRAVAAVALLLAVCGIAAALWHQLVATRSPSCNLTLADRIVGATRLDRLVPDVFEARASCAEGAVTLLGIPYALWAAAGFAVCAVLLLRIARLPLERRRAAAG